MKEHEYRVVYRRTSWEFLQQKVFQSEAAALRLASRLQGGGRSDLAPLDYLSVEKRVVGPWEQIGGEL